MYEDTRLIELKGISKAFGETQVLHNVDMYIRRREFVTLLGPSGCGKTTMLRIIGGFETPDAGQVIFDGKDIASVPPYRRRVNTVFQKYALFTHLNVYDNIAFGLNLKTPQELLPNVPKPSRRQVKAEIDRRIQRMLRLVKMEGYEKRSVDSLSGGQQQRIAIARALVNEPEVLLLDEPLGALDLKLRRAMQSELKRIQSEVGISFVYITHDQEEALNMSDRIALMNGGRFEQIGAPEEVYERPGTRFAARFMGESALFEGTVLEASSGLCRVETPEGEVLAALMPGVEPGFPAAVSVHSERITLSTVPRPGYTLRGRVTERRYTGSTVRAEVTLSRGMTMTVQAMGALSALPEPGTTVYPWWLPESATSIPGRAEK